MATLKRWESPRKRGRNDKGRGGAARQRQLKKRNQRLRQQLADKKNENAGKERPMTSLFYWVAIAPSSYTPLISVNALAGQPPGQLATLRQPPNSCEESSAQAVWSTSPQFPPERSPSAEKDGLFR